MIFFFFPSDLQDRIQSETSGFLSLPPPSTSEMDGSVLPSQGILGPHHLLLVYIERERKAFKKSSEIEVRLLNRGEDSMWVGTWERVHWPVEAGWPLLSFLQSWFINLVEKDTDIDNLCRGFCARWSVEYKGNPFPDLKKVKNYTLLKIRTWPKRITFVPSQDPQT